MRLVLIEWLDSLGCSSQWQPITDVRPDSLACKSVGWLAYDGKDCKVVIPHVSEPHEDGERHGCGDMTIPTKAVVRIADLQEAKTVQAKRPAKKRATHS